MRVIITGAAGKMTDNQRTNSPAATGLSRGSTFQIVVVCCAVVSRPEIVAVSRGLWAVPSISRPLRSFTLQIPAVLGATATVVRPEIIVALKKGNMKSQNPLAACDQADFDPLRFSRREVAVYDNPFFHGCIDNYLPEHIYQQLLETFPDQTLRINYDSNVTLESTAPRLNDLWRAGPFCKNLLSFFTSAAFLQDLKEFVMPAINRERGSTNPTDWFYVNAWTGASQATEGKPIRVTFKFSHLTSGGWIPPHTDNPCKFLSILLYFAEPDWQESYGGGTEIYEPSILTR